MGRDNLSIKRRGRPRKTYHNYQKYKKSRFCPCGKELTTYQDYFCSNTCRTNQFYGSPQYRYNVVEYYFPGCGHTRIISTNYLRTTRGRYCSINCVPNPNLRLSSVHKNDPVYGPCGKIVVFDGLAQDIETRKFVRYKV